MICRGCNYPIPSWQHQGACKPVEDKVPERRTFVAETAGREAFIVYAKPSRVKDTGLSSVTEIASALPKRRGRPKGSALTPAQKQAAYRERKKQG